MDPHLNPWNWVLKTRECRTNRAERQVLHWLGLACLKRSSALKVLSSRKPKKWHFPPTRAWLKQLGCTGVSKRLILPAGLWLQLMIWETERNQVDWQISGWVLTAGQQGEKACIFVSRVHLCERISSKASRTVLQGCGQAEGCTTGRCCAEHLSSAFFAGCCFPPFLGKEMAFKRGDRKFPRNSHRWGAGFFIGLALLSRGEVSVFHLTSHIWPSFPSFPEFPHFLKWKLPDTLSRAFL